MASESSACSTTMKTLAGVAAVGTVGAAYLLGRCTAGKSKPQVKYCPDSRVVLLEYEDLINPDIDLSAAIEEAFGYDGLGIIAVHGVPNFVRYRAQLLPLAHRFANLAPEVKRRYEHPESQFSFGWSHGKETFDGRPDFAKGSYYNNPLHDKPVEDEAIIEEFASFAHPNIWPRKELPELEMAFKQMGQLMFQVGLLVARHCDRFVHKKDKSYPKDQLYRIIKECRTPKGRLLHYFPREDYGNDEALNKEEDKDDLGSWCGWHNDHGSLTALCPGMYLDSEGREVQDRDPNAGLYIRTRRGDVVKGNIPNDCMPFQIGESQQIHSGGLLQATPHCVRSARGSRFAGVSRQSFALFLEPEWDETMRVAATSRNKEQVCHGSSAEFLPRGVPPLDARWESPDVSFGDFTAKTLQTYTLF